MDQWVPVVVHHQRYDMCRACEHSEIIDPDLTCKVCGCLLLMMTRTKSQKCPINKWLEYTDPNQ